MSGAADNMGSLLPGTTREGNSGAHDAVFDQMRVAQDEFTAAFAPGPRQLRGVLTQVTYSIDFVIFTTDPHNGSFVLTVVQM